MIKKNFTLLGLQKLMLLALAFCCSIQIGFAQPANDLCAGATDLTPLLGGATNTLPFATDGTTDSGVQNGACSASGLDNFFTWTATTDQLSFTSLAPGNPGIAVYASCADATAGNEIDCLTTFSTGDVNGWAVGDVVIVQIYDFDGSSSDVAFALEATMAPAPAANNDCADAIPLSVGIGGCDTPVDGSDIGATASGLLPAPSCGTVVEDVFYSVVVPAGGTVTVEMDAPLVGTPNTGDYVLNIYSGTCGGALTEVGCNDDGGPGLYPSVTLTGQTPGETLLVRVWDFANNNESIFSICAFAPATFCDFVPPLTVDGPADYEICRGEDTELELAVDGGGAFPDAFATLVFPGSDFATFNLANAATPNRIAGLNGQGLFSLEFAEGVLYGLDADVNNLVTIDPATGAQTVVGAMGIDPADFLTGLAYDQSTSTMYATGVVIGATNLYTVDLTTGAATLVAGNANTAIWLAINEAGNAYFLDLLDDNIYSIDLTTAASTLLGPVGTNVNFAQGAAFDPATGLLVAALYDGTSTSYQIIDLTTGAGTDIGLGINDEVGGLALQAGANALTYSWSPATGLSCTTCPNPIASPDVTTTYTVTVSDACGNVVTFMTTVEVNFPTGLGNGNDIICNGINNASVSEDCTVTVTADEIVTGDLDCPGLFGVEIEANNGQLFGGTINVGGSSAFQVGDTVRVRVVYPDGSNSCWGFLVLEDKTAPTITCTDVTVECNDLTTVAAIGQPVVVEPCGGVTLTSSDAVVMGNCTNGFLRQILRTFIATNASGMSDTCTQVITVNRQGLADLDDPALRDYDGFDLPTISCDDPRLSNPDSIDANGNLLPEVTGFPTVNGVPVSEACGLRAEYEDDVELVCSGTRKIFRTWTIIDWCVPAGGNANNRVILTQFIKIEDSTGPVVSPAFPTSVTVSTDFDNCSTDYLLPVPPLTDVCSDDALISYTATLDSPGGILVALPSGGFVAQDLPLSSTTALGKSIITYTAEDACGNQTTFSLDVIVTDQINPVMSCETFREVTLQNINPEEPALVFAAAFDDGSYDACGPVTFEVRRMTGCIDFDWTTLGAGIDSDPNGFLNFRDRGTSSFYPAVPFSCCDIGNVVMVELRATDASGNSNSCMVEVNVVDKANPIVDCPANVTIECGDAIPPITDFLTATGTPVFEGTPFAPGPQIGFFDGVIDNCGAELFIRESGEVDECGIGQITRRFQARDASNNLSAICNQRIIVINSDPFEIVDTECRTFPDTPGDSQLNPVGPRTNEDDVEWPCDLVLNCGVDPTPDNLEMTPGVNPLDARPQLQRNDECDIIAMTFEDFELPIVNNIECRKILRTWTITDHCQFEINNSTGEPTAGFWQYTQLIKIVDNQEPVLTCAPVAGTEDADPITCDATVPLTIEADGGICVGEVLRYTYAIDANNDGTIDITGEGNDATGVFPIGEHRIIWSVEDFCGNVGDDCEQLFYVVDNAGPNITAITALDVNISSNTADNVVWSTEFEVSSFDICSDTILSLVQKPSLGDGQTSPPTTAGISITFSCADLPAGASDAVIPVDYWLQDGAGNWSYVTVLVNVDDSQGICGPTAPTATVAGTIMTEELETVNNVTVAIDGNATEMPTAFTTDASGAYSFELETMMNYTVEPSRNTGALDGITTYDLILLGQHILGIQELDSPYKRIAADVDNSGSISSLDMIALRKLILFIDTEFAANTSWRFVEEAYTFPNPANPFATTFPEVINYNDLSQDQLDADFVAIKIGDLNNSVNPALLQAGDTRSADGSLVFNVADQALTAGNEYTVEVKANNFKSIEGYQFTVDFDQDAVDFVDFNAGALALNSNNFGFAKLNEGAITTSWNAKNATTIANDEVLFTLTFKAKADAQLSKTIAVDQVRFTAAEAYTSNGDLFDVAFEFNGKTAGDFALLQNRPNPFRNETVIEFNLPEAADATLTVYDLSGRTIYTEQVDGTTGLNQVTVNRADLKGAGVMYYQIDTPTQSATMKMIVID